MTARIRHLLLTLLAASLLLLSACGGGDGGSTSNPAAAAGEAGSPNAVDSSRDPVAYSEAETIYPFITAATIPDDGRAIVDFQLTDAVNTAIIDLTTDDIRLIIAKLQDSPVGNLTGNWQSYINTIEQPGVGPGTESKLQATTESGTAGALTNNRDGTYRYRFAASVTDIPETITTQAGAEGLDLAYQPRLSHRIAIQFSNAQQPANPVYDWIPGNGQTEYIFHLDVAATANCNNCHDQLAFHGGGRTEIKYCVTCHNPGSTDANSGNSLDLKVMAHKIHLGAQLPSVQAGGEYAIWGFNDTRHDYSNLQYPGDILACERCHAGTASDPGDGSLQLTHQGDNWREHSQRASCGSCHDDLDFSQHYGGQGNDDNCMSCHGIGGAADTIASTHQNRLKLAQQQFAAEVIAVSDTAPGETPTVRFRIYNPEDDSNYDILNDPLWQDSNSSLSVTLGWSTSDYTNTGNGGDNASTMSVSAKADARAAGDGTFSVTFDDQPIPDGSIAPGLAASGSGATVIEGRAAVDIGGDGSVERVPLTNSVGFFSIDEVDDNPQTRRQSATLSGCDNCHQGLVFHGGNRSDNLDSCVTCHNPRNTDWRQRNDPDSPPSPPVSDGKPEESIDFKTMVHGIHAAAYREQPLEIVGFGASTHRYDPDAVQYPGRLSNCLACHTEDGYTLPIASSVLATTIATGADKQDPTDDTVISPISAACSSCHDNSVSKEHMETTGGGNFATSQQEIDDGKVVEQCEQCHGADRSSDINRVHSITP